MKQPRARAGRRRTLPSAPLKDADGSDVFRVAVSLGSSLLAAAGWMVEKELSVGVEIAKFVEDRLPKVPAVTAGVLGAPIRRVSLDASKFSGLTGDALRVMAGFLAGRLGGIVNFAVKPTVQRMQESTEAVAVLQIPGPLSPGQTGERILMLDNESTNPTGKLTVASSDLFCASGGRIAADCVRFEPATLSVPAHGRARIVVGVTVPKETPRGSYAGVLQGAGLTHHGGLIRVDVA